MEDQKFKVGERVYYQPLGWGVVTAVNIQPYPVVCRFEVAHSVPHSFRRTGEIILGCGIQSLFRANSGVLKFDTTELPDWPVDHPIWVRDSANGIWVPRHFYHFGNGFAVCYLDGHTSHSEPVVLKSRWKYYTDVDPYKGGE